MIFAYFFGLLPFLFVRLRLTVIEVKCVIVVEISLAKMTHHVNLVAPVWLVFTHFDRTQIDKDVLETLMKKVTRRHTLSAWNRI